IPTITYSGRLRDFWKDAPFHKPDPTALQGFRSYLIEHTQLNGSMYKRLPVVDSRARIVWSPDLSLLRVLARKEIDRSQSEVQPGNTARHYKGPDGALVQQAHIRTKSFP